MQTKPTLPQNTSERETINRFVTTYQYHNTQHHVGSPDQQVHVYVLECIGPLLIQGLTWSLLLYNAVVMLDSGLQLQSLQCEVTGKFALLLFNIFLC